ncbi:MAG: YlbF family regulator [Peptostreptococcaceae bacterium]|nr:YlbF family regulator [Peptostreptococcaceae bacterium]
MNVYDAAHNLAKAIKDSEEYIQYEEIKNSVSGKEELAGMLNDFQSKQFEIQAKQMTGEEIGEEMMGQIQSLYGIMMQDPTAAQYLQAEIRFSLMMNDIYKILGDVISLGNKQPTE